MKQTSHNNVPTPHPATHEMATDEPRKLSAAAHTLPGFKGYTLEEIRYRRMVNSLKIDVIKEKLSRTIGTDERKAESAVAGYVQTFQNLMQWFDIVMIAVGAFRKIASVFSFFSPRKKR